MPVPLSGGRVTPGPDVPTVLKTCHTPTERLPGSPTVAVAIVTTPRFSTGSTELVLVVSSADVVVVADESPPHALVPTARAASSATSTHRERERRVTSREKRRR